MNIIIIENKVFLRCFIEELLNQIEGSLNKFIFSINNKEQKMSKCVDIVINPFTLSINNSKIVKKIYEHLTTDTSDEEMLITTYDLNNHITSYVETLIGRSGYNLTCNSDMIFPEFFKMLNVKFNENYESLLDRIMDYIELMSDVIGIKIFIFYNLKTLLDDQELLFLYNYCLYNKIHLMLIEQNMNTKLNHEVYYIIDKDLCEIF